MFRWTAMLAAAGCFWMAAGAARAQTTCEFPRVMIVLDKSSSMNGLIEGGSKWNAATQAVTNLVTTHGSGIHFGLMVFPGTNQCTPGKVTVDVGPNSAASMASYLADPPPASGSYTPMAQSLDEISNYAPLLGGSQRNFVLLITDGWQWCDPYDPATRRLPIESAQRLRALGIKTYVVGFGSGVDVETLNKVAFEGGTSPTGCNPLGTDPAAVDRCYYQADSRSDLDAALQQIARTTAAETCDGQDNDCDGFADNANAGDPAPMTKACSSVCGGGVQTCVGGVWTACNAQTPVSESCDGQDNDCDGFVDNAMPGNPAPLTRSCSSACGTGTERCEGGRWLGCDAPTPRAESCNGRDDDCDGFADNATAGAPAPLTRACETVCGSGTETCTGGTWTGCTAREPTTEICNDGIDNNCNGLVDEGCECQMGDSRACGSNIGVCREGVQRCTATGFWGECEGGQAPGAEACDGLDNDCNGTIDNGAVCTGDAICACGGCANPCRNGECPTGAVCTGGYCVFDRCPDGMYCEGTACVPGERPTPPEVDNTGGNRPQPPAEGDPVSPPDSCGCAAGSGTSGLGMLLPLLLALALLWRRRRRRTA